MSVAAAFDDDDEEPFVLVHRDAGDTERNAAMLAAAHYPLVALQVLNHLLRVNGDLDYNGAVINNVYLNTWAPARHYLKRVGYVVDSGERRRSCRKGTLRDPEGPRCIIWEVTDAGLDYWKARRQFLDPALQWWR